MGEFGCLRVQGALSYAFILHNGRQEVGARHYGLSGCLDVTRTKSITRSYN